MARMEQSFLPSFASEANQATAHAIEILRRELRAADDELFDHTDTISELSKHVTKSHREVDYATSLLLERSNQFSVGEHLHQLEIRQLVSATGFLTARRQFQQLPARVWCWRPSKPRVVSNRRWRAGRAGQGAQSVARRRA